MPKLNKECIDEARQALINFGEEELSEYVRDVFARAKSYEDLGSNGFEDSKLGWTRFKSCKACSQ